MSLIRALGFAVATLWATSTLPAQPPTQTEPAKDPVAKPADAPKATPKETEDDLNKQVEDALKQLEKLEKVVPDDVREQMQQQLQNRIRIVGNGIVIRNGIIINNGIPQNLPRPAVGTPVALGLYCQTPVPILIEHLKLEPGQGQMVNNVLPDSAAAKAGIQRFDVLLELAGKPVPANTTDFYASIRELKPGADVYAKVLRRGKTEVVKGLKVPNANDPVAPLPVPFPGQFPGQDPRVPPPLIGDPDFLPRPVPPIRRGGIARPGVFGLPVERLPQLQDLTGVRLNRIQTIENGDETIQIKVADDDFKVDYRKGELRATVTGKVDAGTSTLGEASIQDGAARVTARSMDQVPERYRAAIARVLEAVK